MAAILSQCHLPKNLGLTDDEAAMMILGANAKAARVAPCLVDNPTDGQLAEARLILAGAIKRWAEAGSGALQSQTAGPFSQATDTRQRTGYNLWPSEIAALQDICAEAGASGQSAFSTEPGAGSAYTNHLPWCSAMFLASYCSCGADIAQRPIYENAPWL